MKPLDDGLRWHLRPFNITQQVLRNRILGVEAGFKSLGQASL